MKVLGLTGGIGSGKSTVAVIFKSLGIPVFNSDQVAKELYQKREVLLKVTNRFGEDIIENNVLNFGKLATIIFNDQKALEWINSLIHPLVKEEFETWKAEQKSSCVLKESAILIESKGHLTCDIVITVEASSELRITRTMERDQISRVAVEARMGKQMTDLERNEVADYVINNDGETLIPQVVRIVEDMK